MSAPPPDEDPAVAAVGERRLVDHIRTLLPPAPPWVLVGPGDDAAVVEPERNRLEVLTTDVLVEHVHFDWALVSPEDVGHKALAVNLSDLAAMGALPRVALLSLVLPDAMRLADLTDLVRGFAAAARAHGVAVVGGNVARSPGGLTIDVTVTGTVHRRRLLTRAGGRPDDELFVTGHPGDAAAGLLWLRHAGRDAEPDPAVAPCVAAFRRPEPRLRIGLQVGRNRAASACIDLSDGLAAGVRQLAEASGTGAVVEADALPLRDATRGIFERAGLDPWHASLTGGEEYELLFAVPRQRTRRFGHAVRLALGLSVTRVGTLTQGREVTVRKGDRHEELPTGFAHFAGGPAR